MKDMNLAINTPQMNMKTVPPKRPKFQYDSPKMLNPIDVPLDK